MFKKTKQKIKVRLRNFMVECISACERPQVKIEIVQKDPEKKVDVNISHCIFGTLSIVDKKPLLTLSEEKDAVQ